MDLPKTRDTYFTLYYHLDRYPILTITGFGSVFGLVLDSVLFWIRIPVRFDFRLSKISSSV